METRNIDPELYTFIKQFIFKLADNEYRDLEKEMPMRLS